MNRRDFGLSSLAGLCATPLLDNKSTPVEPKREYDGFKVGDLVMCHRFGDHRAIVTKAEKGYIDIDGKRHRQYAIAHVDEDDAQAWFDDDELDMIKPGVGWEIENG